MNLDRLLERIIELETKYDQHKTTVKLNLSNIHWQITKNEMPAK